MLDEEAEHVKFTRQSEGGAAVGIRMPAPVVLEEEEEEEDEASEGESKERRTDQDKDAREADEGVREAGESLVEFDMSPSEWRAALRAGGGFVQVGACHTEVVSVVMQGYRVVALCADNTARFIDVATGRLIKSVARPGIAWCAAVSQGVVLCACDDQSLWALDLLTGSCLTTMRGHSSTIAAADLDRHYAVSADSQGSVRVWDLRRNARDGDELAAAGGAEGEGGDASAGRLAEEGRCEEEVGKAEGGSGAWGLLMRLPGASRDQVASDRANAGCVCVCAAEEVHEGGALCAAISVRSRLIMTVPATPSSVCPARCGWR